MAENTNERQGTNSKRGLASADPETRQRVARMGGKAAHERGVAHEFTSEEARAAGKKGGQAVSRDREHMREIGKRGGESSGES